MSDKILTLNQRVAHVQKNIGYVAKSGKFDAGKTKYKYATEVDTVAAVKTLCAEIGIVLYLSVIEAETVLIKKDETGYVRGMITRVHTTLELVSSDDDKDSRIVHGWGDGFDSLDKGIFKAITGANKYCLFKAFQIPTGDDPEVPDKSSVAEYKKPVRSIEALNDIIVAELPKCRNIIAFNALHKRWEKVHHTYDDVKACSEIDDMFAKRKAELEPNEPAENLEKKLAEEPTLYDTYNSGIKKAPTLPVLQDLWTTISKDWRDNKLTKEEFEMLTKLKDAKKEGLSNG